jgi:hypothetical protein
MKNEKYTSVFQKTLNERVSDKNILQEESIPEIILGSCETKDKLKTWNRGSTSALRKQIFLRELAKILEEETAKAYQVGYNAGFQDKKNAEERIIVDRIIHGTENHE